MSHLALQIKRIWSPGKSFQKGFEPFLSLTQMQIQATGVLGSVKESLAAGESSVQAAGALWQTAA